MRLQILLCLISYVIEPFVMQYIYIYTHIYVTIKLQSMYDHKCNCSNPNSLCICTACERHEALWSETAEIWIRCDLKPLWSEPAAI